MEVKVGKITVEYWQDSDDYSEDKNPQCLEITAQPSLLHLYENGEQSFYFALKTERFAFDSLEELASIMNDFKKRIKEI